MPAPIQQVSSHNETKRKRESLEKDTESNKEASATQSINLQSASLSSTLETSNQGFEMQSITWLHLSDWHQTGKDFNRKIIRDALMKDIKNCAQIDSALEKIDFIVFSGDVAFFGKKEEYDAAITEFFNPVLGLIPV